ncbi:MAG: hypothetical protein JW909_05100 [Planctomycetes bacterium]|nr:hypothetical protein [Planctomycetota bacterium]
MGCDELRRQFHEGSEDALRSHAGGCEDCRAWLQREEKLGRLLKDMREEADAAAGGLVGRLRRPDVLSAGKIIRYVLVPLACAAAAVVVVLLLKRAEPVPEDVFPTRVLIIEGKISDEKGLPDYVELDGVRFPVERISTTEGKWRVEVVFSGQQRDLVLSAVDSSGNREERSIRIQRDVRLRP